MATDDADRRWLKPCFLCPHHVRCRKEHVERGSKKCHNLLRLDERKRT